MGILIRDFAEIAKNHVSTFLPFSLQYHKITTLRRPLGELSTNITPFNDLSLYIRGKIVGKAEEGKKPTEITKELKVPDQTVRDTLKLDLLRNEGASRACPSRPDKYSDRFKHNLIFFVGKNRKGSYAKIRKHFKSKILNKTTNCILDTIGIYHWRCKKRPFLTEEVVAKRLAWCLARKDWTWVDFCKYIWSNECSTERGAGGA